MNFLQTILNVCITVSLLSGPVTMTPGPQRSFWGKMADFSSPNCRSWRLKPEVSIPALQELTVCFNLQFQTTVSLSPWTAFMYSHPWRQCAELGLGGRSGRLVVWLHGTEWTTDEFNFSRSQWYSLCLTWTHTKAKPALYVNSSPVDMVAGPRRSSCQLAASGVLTLGATPHSMGRDNDHYPALKLSLFRMWGRERSEEEVTSLKCTEGDLVKWERGNWKTVGCTQLPESSLQCEWSLYEVTLMFIIIPSDGNNTELYTARDIAHKWLRAVLPPSIYLHSVSVSEVTGSSKEDCPLSRDCPVRWVPPINSFNCLAHVNVIPPRDVAAVQNEMNTRLGVAYNQPNGQLRLEADPNSIHTTPVESLSIVPPDVVTETTPGTTSTFTTTESVTTVGTVTSVSASETTPGTTSTFTTTASVTTVGTVTSVSASVTTDAAFTTIPANISELYFEVNVNISITGDYDPGQILSTWLNSSLPDDMMVLDIQLLPKAQRSHPKLRSSLTISENLSMRVSRERCIFHVQVMMSPPDAQEMEEQIRISLLRPYENGAISIATEDVQISRILIFQCNAETHHTRKGPFVWPDTSAGRNATLPCPKNPIHHATRHCKLCLSTHWMAPHLEDCHLVVETIPDLDHIDVTADNALDVVEMIEGLLSNHSTLNYQELVTVLNKLEDVVNLSRVTPNLGQAVINIISDILESDSNLVPFTNTILNITEAVGDMMVGYEGSSTLVAPAIAISVVDVAPGQFSNLTFGVSSDRQGTMPEIFINEYPFNGTVAFICLPSALQHSFPPNSSGLSPPRVKFQFYGIPLLFKSSQKGQTLNTFVVSASVTNASSPVKDLEEDVQVTLRHLTPNTLHKDVQCVYWNFNKNNGHGGWDGYGCRKYNSSSDYTTCLCDHLTHFGVLLDVSRTEVDPANDQILTIITYLGCGVSSLFLGVTILTYIAFEKLRRDYPSQILINLSIALLGLNLVFLVNSWVSSWGLYGLCVAVASTMHYFLLASFTWTGLEAVNMYFALVKVFNIYVPSYIRKFCVLGWGIPLLICVLVLIVHREAYGAHIYTGAQHSLKLVDDADNFCWIQDNVTFYVSVVAYAVLVFLFNIAVFVVVLIQIRNMQVNSPAETPSGLLHNLKGVASLTVLLGLTWTVGFFTWGPARVVLLYLFSVLNTLQGLFIFLFHCLMKENVREQWRIHLCFRPFAIDEYSDWSNSVSVGVPPKPKTDPPRAPLPSVCSIKSSSTESTSASSESSQRDSSCKRPDLGLFVHSLALPRAQRNPSGPGALPSQTPGWRDHLLGPQQQR